MDLFPFDGEAVVVTLSEKFLLEQRNVVVKEGFH